MKRLGLTGDQWLGIGIAKLAIALIILAALAGAGCGKMLPPSQQYVDDIVQIERQVRAAEVAVLRQELGKKADTTAMATEFVAVRGEIKAAVAAEKLAREQGIVQLAQRLAGAGREIAGHSRKISILEAASAVQVTTTIAMKQGLADLRQEVSGKADKKAVETMEKKVQAAANTAAARTTALTRRVGTVETTTYDHSGRKVIQLYFPTAKLAKDGSKFEACAEITPHTKTAVNDLIMPAVKDGMMVTRISGFADNRPFVDAKGKPLANSDELNAKCAVARAEAVAKFLMDDAKVSLANATVRGMGKTTRFGRHDADRSVVVELVTAPPTPPAPPAAKLKFELSWKFASEAEANTAKGELERAGAKSVQVGQAQPPVANEWYAFLAVEAADQAAAEAIAAPLNMAVTGPAVVIKQI